MQQLFQLEKYEHKFWILKNVILCFTKNKNIYNKISHRFLVTAKLFTEYYIAFAQWPYL
jgi:hypothetical protein